MKLKLNLVTRLRYFAVIWELDIVSVYLEFYKHGILDKMTSPYSPEINGKAERKNKTLTELIVTIMLNSSIAPH